MKGKRRIQLLLASRFLALLVLVTVLVAIATGATGLAGLTAVRTTTRLGTTIAFTGHVAIRALQHAGKRGYGGWTSRCGDTRLHGEVGSHISDRRAGSCREKHETEHEQSEARPACAEHLLNFTTLKHEKTASHPKGELPSEGAITFISIVSFTIITFSEKILPLSAGDIPPHLEVPSKTTNSTRTRTIKKTKLPDFKPASFER